MTMIARDTIRFRALAASLLPCLAFLLVVSQTTFAQDLDSPIERTYKVRSGGELNVDIDRGSISVESSDRSEVDVLIEREGSDDFLRRMKFTVNESAGGVTVRGEYDGDRRMSWRNNKGNKIRVRVRVPHEYNAVLKTSGGSIDVQDLEGSVDANTSGGSMTFGLIEGPIMARTSGGSITLEGSSGTADVKTSGGSIKVGNVGGSVLARTSGGSISIDRAMGEVDASTSGGRIVVNEVRGTINAKTSGGSIKAFISEQPKGDCTLTTSGGGVDVTLSPDVKVDIDASSSGGGVRTDIPIRVVGEIKRNHVVGTLNGGGPLLKLRTSGGGVKITSTR
jgi:DUF4097 and DUF4098 domain-containing protein YvlB